MAKNFTSIRANDHSPLPLNLFLFISVILVVGLFLFTRLYKISSSYLFYGDPGRDYLVMETWLKTHKPPLLGPQTSALPFNQSALYFYLLMPGYLLSGFSLFSTIITCTVVYVFVFLMGIYLLRNEPRLRWCWFTAFILISLNPQYIIQSRYIWNPSLVPACVLVAFLAFTRLTRKWTNVWVWILAFSLALATGFSYSAVPVLLSFWLLALIRFRLKALRLIGFTLVSLLVVNFPTIIFEFRHSFLLTKMMLFNPKLPQPGNSLSIKLAALQSFFLPHVSLWLVFTCLAVITLAIWRRRRRLTAPTVFADALIFSLLTFILTLAMPVALLAHYSFGILTGLFILIGTLSAPEVSAIVLLCCLSWLQPAQWQNYFKPAPRTVAQTLTCATRFCSQQSQPLYVSIQSGFQPYHDGQDWQFLFLRSGCRVRDINQPDSQTSLMAVVVDNSTYEHGKTAYNELTLFGPSKDTQTFTCQANLNIHILKKI